MHLTSKLSVCLPLLAFHLIEMLLGQLLVLVQWWWWCWAQLGEWIWFWLCCCKLHHHHLRALPSEYTKKLKLNLDFLQSWPPPSNKDWTRLSRQNLGRFLLISGWRSQIILVCVSRNEFINWIMLSWKTQNKTYDLVSKIKQLDVLNIENGRFQRSRFCWRVRLRFSPVSPVPNLGPLRSSPRSSPVPPRCFFGLFWARH